MPIADVMPVSDWRDLQCVLVKSRNCSDDEVAESLMNGRRFKYAQSFKHLRGAVEFLFSNLEMEKKRVVFPKYICGSVARAAARAGLKVEYCEVDAQGNLDPVELLKMPLGEFGAVFVAHAFGNPAQVEKIRAICDSHKMVLVEDCAHSLDIQKTLGDFVLFHFAKRIANAHGGILISADVEFPKLRTASREGFGEIFSLILKSGLLRPILNLYRSTTKIPADADEKSDKSFSAQSPASEGSKRLFMRRLKMYAGEKAEIDKIYRAYFDKLPAQFRAVLSEPIKDFFNFPILVPKDKNRDDILAKLRVYGVFADRIWYNSACGFAKRVLVLPVNKYMNEKDVEMICNLLKNV